MQGIYRLTVSILASVVLFSCNSGGTKTFVREINKDILLECNENLRLAMMRDKFTPPVAARNYAYDQIAPMTGIRGDALHGGGWSVAVPTLAVYDTWSAGDYRRIVSLQEEATIGGNVVTYHNFDVSGHVHAANNPYIAKYIRFPGPFARGNARATSHNYSMIRYAEVLLIAAEAAVEIGNNSEATTYINQVRARARAGGSWKNTPPSTVPANITGTVTVADVLEERRLELAFECKRWYDIARRQLGAGVFSASGLEGAKPFFTSDDYLMPIPGDEIERNPNLTQNPGY